MVRTFVVGVMRGNRSFASRAVVLAAVAVLAVAGAACTDVPPEMRNGLVGGRVLIAPGAGLAGARVSLDQIDAYVNQGLAPECHWIRSMRT
jgi:hypothetical protein